MRTLAAREPHISNVRRQNALATLHFPEHFPPTDPWKKFFIGVRWLGPDLSFFGELKKIQSEREGSDMNAWGGGLRQRLAEAISRVLCEQLGWKSPVLLPGDSAAVAFHGPRFDFNDPESALEGVIETLALDFQIVVPEAFWTEHAEATMGELIDDLAKCGGSKSAAAV